MSEPIIHAWWTRSDDMDMTACGLRITKGDDDDPTVHALWDRTRVTCPECLKTLVAAGVAA